MAIGEQRAIPPCRVGATPEQLAREADRAVLYGAILVARRPQARLKPHLAEAALALAPAVRAFLDGVPGELADHALAYARACGGEAFLLSRREA